MAFTLAQYNELRDAIATGARSIQHDGKRVDFQTPAEMRALLARMEQQLGLRPNTRRNVHTVGF